MAYASGSYRATRDHLSDARAIHRRSAVRKGRGVSRDDKPWFPLYVADFLGDETVKLASNAALGAYVKLLCHQWTHRSVPADPGKLATIVGESLPDFGKLWPDLCQKFAKVRRHADRLVNPRLEVERREADRMLRAKRRGARIANAQRAESAPESGDYAGVQSQSQESKDWPRVLGRAWRDTYGGEAPYGQIGRACKPLVTHHGLPVVEARWRSYLRATEARYASPTRFAQTFGAWGDKAGGLRDAYLKPGDL